MKLLFHNSKFIILLLLVLSARGWAASCPTDSIITYDQNGVPTEKTLYAYDDAGRQTLTETQRLTDGVITSGSKTQTTYYSTGKTQMTAKWTWSTTTNDWVGSEKNEYTYDAKGNTLTWEIYNWGTDDWAKKTKYEYAYEGKNQTLSVYYKGSGTEWIPQTKQIWDYDSAGHLIETASYHTVNGQMVGETRTTTAYNDRGEIDSLTTYSWANNMWQPSKREENISYPTGKVTLKFEYRQQEWWRVAGDSAYNTFNASGKPLTQQIYTWTSNGWTGKSRTDYTYDTSGKPIQTIHYIWQDAGWLPSQREDKAYYTTGNVTTHWEYVAGKWDCLSGDSAYSVNAPSGKPLTQQTYTWASNGWTGKSRTDYTYNDSPVQTFTDTYRWQDGQWIATSRNENSTYPTGTVSATWQYTDNTWNRISGDSTCNTTTNSGKPLGSFSFTWNGNQWVEQAYTEYEYNTLDLNTLTTHYKNGGNDFVKDWETIKTYDARGNLTGETQNNYVSGQRQGLYKYEYQYDTNNYQILNARYTGSGTTWRPETKYEYVFNASGVKTEEKSYIGIANKWMAVFYYQYSFDDSGRSVGTLVQSWNGDSWDNYENRTYEYDEYGKKSKETYYSWENDTWSAVTMDEYVYNYHIASENMIRQETHTRYDQGNLLSFVGKHYYYACDPRYTITLHTSGADGYVTGDGIYTYGACATVRAEGDSVCSSFKQWESLPEGNTIIAGNQTTSVLQIVVTSDMTLTAEFTPTVHTLTAGTNDILHGSVTITTDPPTR